MKLVVIDDYQDAFRTLRCYAKLTGHEVVVHNDTEKDPARLAERLKDADAVILTQARSPFPRALIERLPKLRLVSQTGRSTGHIDVDACTEHGVVVSAAGFATPHPTAELTWGLILAALRHIPYEVQRLREGYWQSTVGVSVQGKTLGIYAHGRIGSLVAHVGRALGARVVCWGREGSVARAREAGYEIAGSRDAFFAESDILSLHLPLNAESRGIVTRADLARMKPSALIVNTSRAGIIAEGALVEALKAGQPGFAAVDVFEDEPVIGAVHPLLKMDNVVATPHLGYVERENYELYYGIVIDQILAYAAGNPINVLNPAVVGKK
ncbi:MAG: D-2-hydroxyacid dehydrogenase family protein [Deltaproteobacteria bacterium]|nr:D-2-hydroxyacid dehydrogenase family protein [Deltaproteobacteria bacterium]MBI3064622.1 D-2-hydroxyacid dehydrogenase family protein [Deltaproteobacteria bacterium]